VPEKNRWKTFYSVGATWNAAKEAFLKDVTFIGDLQVRLGYGTSASPFSSSFGYLSTFASGNYAGVTGLTLNAVGNENYDWEIAKTTNLGIDFSVLKRRLRGSLDLYNKNTENLFINQQLSRTSGANSLSINAGEVNNKGIELALNADVISSKDLKLSVGANAAYNKNEITNLGQVNEFVQGTGIIRVGLPLGTHYIPRWGGVDAATGAPLYYTKEGALTNAYNSSTMSVADFGTWQPPVTGGFNGSLNYKGFYLEAFFSFASGGKRYNNEDFFNEVPSFATSNQSSRMLNRWRKPGDITDIQKFGTARNFSSKDIQDASFVRFRNFNVGYNLPSNLTPGFLKTATIFVQGQNVYTWTKWRGFDPEDNNNISTFEYPNARTFTFGINASF
jgi:outer membrane receptor protein involved in Fe transport